MTETPAIDVRGATKTFGQGEHLVTALDQVSVEIRKGEFFTLLGPSGCGKTTLLRLIAGFEAPTSGTILLNGKDITGDPPNHRPVNTVFQSYALFPHLTVAENISFGLEMLDKPKSECRETVERMLALVQLGALAGRKTAQLSGGQQQRVALARALAPQPQVLLLDEPLSALDLKLRKEMQSELKRLQTETGITFIFVTHDQEEALTMSDRIAVMSAGKILQIGAPRDIYAHPVNRFVADFIGETNFLTAEIADGSARLDGGGVLAVPGVSIRGRRTLAVRPEHLRLSAKGGNGGLAATVTQTVYFGTDSHVHLRLDDGSELVARLQTDAGGATGPQQGDRVSVSVADGAVQVLDD
ncbi:MAG: ABC transporter ATP-binding protein [Paracoccaceae bacterium]